MRTPSLVSALLVGGPLPVSAVLAACSDQAATSDGTRPGSDPTLTVSSEAPRSGMGDPITLVGTFQVKLTPASNDDPARATVVGKVFDGPSLNPIVWEKPQVEGACTLTTPRVPFCAQPCGGTAACVEDDTCQNYPTARSVGAVTLHGLETGAGEQSFTMTPIANAYQPPAGVTFAYPPFAEGDAVILDAEGDYFSGFSLTSSAVAPLELAATPLALDSGQPLELDWTPGSVSDASIHVKLDISHHGGTRGQIECDQSDTGSLTVSASLVTQLLELGIAGYPTVIVTRHVTGSAVIAAGRVDLEIASVVERGVTLPGLISCTVDADCPSGKQCQSDLSCM